MLPLAAGNFLKSLLPLKLDTCIFKSPRRMGTFSSALHTIPTSTHSLPWWPSFFLSLPHPFFCFSFSPSFSKRVAFSIVFFTQSLRYHALLATSLFVFYNLTNSTSNVSIIKKTDFSKCSLVHTSPTTSFESATDASRPWV